MHTSSLAILFAALGAVVDVGCAFEVNGNHLLRRDDSTLGEGASASNTQGGLPLSQKDKQREFLRGKQKDSLTRLKAEQEQERSGLQGQYNELAAKRAEFEDKPGTYGRPFPKHHEMEELEQHLGEMSKEHRTAMLAKYGQHSDEMAHFRKTGKLDPKRTTSTTGSTTSKSKSNSKSKKSAGFKNLFHKAQA